ncbi:MAG: acetylglutamate kinase [Bryobacteraceae bacterium]
MKLLVKLGGTLLDADESRARLARELAQVARQGHHLVVVHGGGKQMTRFLGQMGVESRFIDGLRVTTPETIDAVLKVFAGSVNKQLVAALIEAGAEAVGLSGIDGCLVEAELLRADLGQVGRPVRANARLLDCLLAGGFLPVVACVAGDRQGRIYNVNADQMAVACAAAFQADKLVFLTDVDGVLGADKQRIPLLSLSAAEALIAGGVATGGMQAKLTSAGQAIREGVPEVIIAPGAAEGGLGRLLGGEALGTRMVRG